MGRPYLSPLMLVLASESLVLGLRGPGVGGLLPQTPEPLLPVLGRRLSWERGREREDLGRSLELEGDLEAAVERRPLVLGGERTSRRLGEMLADLGRFLLVRPREAETSVE